VIIGEYVVNPFDVVYGRREWIASAPTYLVTIQIKTDVGIITLSQYSPNDKESKALIKLIEKCVEERKQAILDGLLSTDAFSGMEEYD